MTWGQSCPSQLRPWHTKIVLLKQRYNKYSRYSKELVCIIISRKKLWVTLCQIPYTILIISWNSLCDSYVILNTWVGLFFFLLLLLLFFNYFILYLNQLAFCLSQWHLWDLGVREAERQCGCSKECRLWTSGLTFGFYFHTSHKTCSKSFSLTASLLLIIILMLQDSCEEILVIGKVPST